MSAWLAYICGIQGHVVMGSGTGTDPASIVWATHCHRCGARLFPPGTDER